MSSNIKLISNDLTAFEIDAEAAAMIGVFGPLFKYRDSNHIDEPIKLDNVDGETLGRIVGWLNKHKKRSNQTESNGDANANNTDRYLRQLTHWEQEYFNLPKDKLFALLRASNYLDIESLYNQCCKAVAGKVEQMPEDGIRQFFQEQ